MKFLAFCFLSTALFLVPRVVAADDRLAHEVKPSSKSRIMRLISLAPSNTELVYSLGAGSELVGVSESCDYPAEVKAKAQVGNFSSLKMEKIAGLHPDLCLLVSGQESLALMLKKHGFKTFVMDNSSVDNIGKNMIALGEAIDRSDRAKKLAEAFDSSIKELNDLVKHEKSLPRIFICIWPQPLMSAGKTSFMSEGVTIAGGINCTGDLPQPYPRVNPERLLLLQPDYILVTHELGKELFWKKSPWTSMNCVKANHVVIMPQHETDCLIRPTLRFVDALYWLSCKLHPDLKAAIDKWKLETAKHIAAAQ